MFRNVWKWIRVAFKILTTVKKHEALIKPIIDEAKRELETRNAESTDPGAGKDSDPVGDPPPDPAHENKQLL